MALGQRNNGTVQLQDYVMKKITFKDADIQAIQTDINL